MGTYCKCAIVKASKNQLRELRENHVHDAQLEELVILFTTVTIWVDNWKQTVHKQVANNVVESNISTNVTLNLCSNICTVCRDIESRLWEIKQNTSIFPTVHCGNSTKQVGIIDVGKYFVKRNSCPKSCVAEVLLTVIVPVYLFITGVWQWHRNVVGVRFRCATSVFAGLLRDRWVLLQTVRTSVRRVQVDDLPLVWNFDAGKAISEFWRVWSEPCLSIPYSGRRFSYVRLALSISLMQAFQFQWEQRFCRKCVNLLDLEPGFLNHRCWL